MPRLVYVDRQGIERSVPIGMAYPRVTVGRNPDCTIQVTKPSVSRLHSEFTFNQAGLEVTDLGSSNGTFVNGREVKRQALRDRDEVKCGDFVLRVFMEDDSNAVSQPPSTYPPPTSSQGMGYQPQPTQLPTSYDYSRTPPSRSGSTGPNATPPPAAYDPYAPAVPQYGDQSSAPRNRGYSTTPPAQYPGEPDPYGRSGSYGQQQPASGPYGQVSGGRSTAPPAAMPGETDAQRLARENQYLRDQLSEKDTIIQVLQEGGGGGGGGMAGPNLQPEVERLSRENAELRTERDKLRLDYADLLRNSGDGDQRSVDMRRELEQKQLTIDSIQDRYAALKNQSDDQLKQIEEQRAKIKEARDTINDLEYRHREVQQAQQKGSAHVGELIEENADLKVRVNQLERQLEEAQRNANLTEFELKKVRQEAENLRLMIDAEGSENVGLQDELNHLRQVIDVKEADIIAKERELEDMYAELEGYRHTAGNDDQSRKRMQDEARQQRTLINELEAQVAELRERLKATPAASAAPAGPSPELLRELDELRRDNQRLQEELEEASAGGGSAAQINQLKRQNRDLRHQIEDLEEEVERLRAGGGGGSSSSGGGADPAALRKAEADLDAARDEIEALRVRLTEAQRGSSGGAAAGDSRELDRLKRENRRMEDELEDLAAQLKRASSSAAPAATGGGSGPDVERIRKSARDLTQNINDIVSTLRNNMQLMRDYITDIRKIYDAIQRADLQAIPTVDRMRIEKALREVEPDVTFEELNHLLGDSVNDSEELKDQILRFKDEVAK